MFTRLVGLFALALLVSNLPSAQDQTVPGAGNGAAVEIARRSQLVKTATEFLIDQAKSLSDETAGAIPCGQGASAYRLRRRREASRGSFYLGHGC